MRTKIQPPKKIAIIGAGLTGLTAAYRLAQAGHKVTVFESQGEIGGLASGFAINGSHIEKTYHHLFKTDKHILDLIEEFGLGEKMEWHKSKMSIYTDSKFFSFSSPLDLLKFKPLNFFDRIRTGLVFLYLQKTKNWKKFVKISAAEWTRKMNGEAGFKKIWEPLLKGKFHELYDQVSMAWLWARIHIRANSRDGGEALGYPVGGFQIIIDKFQEKLEELGVEIRTNQLVKKIIAPKAHFPHDKENKISVLVDDKSKQFDKILLTTPSHIFANLVEGLSDEYMQKLKSIKYLGAVCAVFTSKQNLSNYYWHNINDLSSPFLVYINHTQMIDKSNYNDEYVYYIGVYIPHEHRYFESKDEEIFGEWFEYLKKLFPEFEIKNVVSKYLFKFKNAQHVPDMNYQDKIPDYVTPIPNVYLANFSQIFPEDRGTNYAVREGEEIARIILNQKLSNDEIQ